MRLSKYLANSGIASRRKAEELILSGIIKVNGKVIKELGTKVDPEKDKITINNKSVSSPKAVYYLLNKPKGFTTTVKDPYAKKTVLELVETNERIFPVGRLDRSTEGLLILTNDGDLTFKLTHPRYEKEKEYEVLTKDQLTEEELKKLETGIKIENKLTGPANIRFIRKDKDKFFYSITIKEGRNRQVRKMFDSLGHPVLELKRIRIDFLTLGKLKKGEYRELSKKEIEKLRK